MPHRWPADTDFRLWELDVLDRDCASCGRMMHICDHRYRHFYTLEGPVELVCKLNHCPNPDCPGHAKTKSPEMEATIALPAWAIGWDVFCWIGHRRFSRHWSIPQIRHELSDSYAIELTEPCIALYVQRYHTKSGKSAALLFHGLCPSGKIDWAYLESHQELDRCLSRTITASKNFND